MSLNVVEKLPPLSDLAFGRYYGPQMIEARYEQGQWKAWELKKTENFSIHPGAKVLHYAQEIFEGLKAFHTGKGVALFRPQANIRRMIRSAEILAMVPYPESDYLEALKSLVRKQIDLVPKEPGALYLRPTMIGTTSTLGVATSTEYLFYILACPVGGYFGDINSDKPASVSVQITEKFVRAVRGGLGAAKTGANYAASLLANSESKKAGFNNTLFLDAIERRYLEELSGMNVFVVENGVLKTPPLGDTILEGVTRDSLIKIARSLKIPVEETPIDVFQLLSGLKEGRVSEVFACGTASAVTSISELGFRGERIKAGNGQAGEITTRLYQKLLNIYAGREEAPEANWLVHI